MFAMSLDEEFKNNPFMILLNPVLTLMGSVMEGTRIGIGNEADFMMTFLGFKEPPFKVNENDPFHLIASDNVPDWMETYFDQDQQFILHKFMKDLLNAVSSCIDKIFQYELNPPSLFRKTSNEQIARIEDNKNTNLFSNSASIVLSQCRRPRSVLVCSLSGNRILGITYIARLIWCQHSQS
jgi:hypothetical protein